jgi:hypothetical protein
MDQNLRENRSREGDGVGVRRAARILKWMKDIGLNCALILPLVLGTDVDILRMPMQQKKGDLMSCTRNWRTAGAPVSAWTLPVH